MDKTLKLYVTGGLEIRLNEIAASLDSKDQPYKVEVKDLGEEVLRAITYDCLDDALAGFDAMVINLDRLIWEEDCNSEEEYRKC